MRIDSPKMTNSNATGSFTGSFAGDGSLLTGLTTASYIDFNNVDLGATTLLSSSAQISSDISGSFTAASSSFSTRVTDLESFSSSLDSTLLTLSGSFSGSFIGDGSQLSGVTSYTDADTLAYINSIGVLSGSGQIASDISGSFTSLSQSIASDIADIIDGTQIVTSASYALTSSYNENPIISGSISGADWIDFTVGTTVPYAEGRLFYDDSQGALAFYNDEAEITLQIGQEFYKRAYNASGQRIDNGTPVRISGSQGDMPLIWPAYSQNIYSGSYNARENKFIGIATHHIEDNSVGYVTEKGIVRGINTTNFPAGSQLYLQTGSNNIGVAAYRTDPPPFPYDVTQVGVVVRSQSNGFVEVVGVRPITSDDISGIINITTQVINDESTTIAKGTPVHATSEGNGPVPRVKIAKANDPTLMPATFVTTEAILSGSQGQVLAIGYIYDVDTSAFNVGDIAYVAPNGGYTNQKPTGSNELIQNLGVVLKSHATEGSGFMYGAGRSNDVPNLAGGKIWVGDENGHFATSSIITLDETGGELQITGSTIATGNITADTFIGTFQGALSSSAQIASDISGSFTALSSSVSTRLTDNETSLSSINAATSSYALAANISGSFTSVSSSLASRLSTAESELNNSLISASAQVDHDQTTNFVPDEHIAHSTITLTAGSGLTGGGTIASSRTFNVGQGDGISVSADAVAVDSTVARRNAANSYSEDQTFQNIFVNGTGSFAYINAITGSAKIIGDNYIILNADTPSERYSGIKVIDSGSAGATGSLEYDSVANHWFYESTSEGYAAVLMSGPKASRGGLTVPTSGSLVVASGNHLYTSHVSDLNGTVTISVDTDVQGTLDATNLAIGGTTLDQDIATLSLPASTTISTFGASLVDDANAAAARTTLGVDAAGTDNSTNVTLNTTSHDYLSLSGQQITLGIIDISDDTNLAAGTGLTLTGDTIAIDSSVLTTADEGSGNGLDADTVDGLQASQFLRSDATDSTSGTLTIGGGLVVEGSAASGGTDYGYYENAGTNIILKGDSNGRSGIFFQSEKDGTSINHPSDFGFLQFHSYGYGGTTGEANALVLGVANDSTDIVVLQSPYNNGVKIGYRDATSGTGLTLQTVLHTGNYTSTLDGRYYTETESDSRFVNVTGDTMTGVLTIQSSNDNQLLVQGTDTWAGIGFDDSNSGTDYIWYNGSAQTFAIGGGGANVSGKKLHVDGGMSVGANADSTATPTNGLYVEGSLQLGSSFQAGTNVSAGYYQDTANGAYRAITSSGTNGYYFQSNAGGSTRMYIGLHGTYAGRVGINNQTPSAILDVNGSTAGETVFEVTGTSGQLFSIVDDLTGDIFNVSDATGVPILTVNASGTVTIDDTLNVTGDITAYYSSDERLKDNITEISNANEKILKLRGVEFDWNGNSKNEGHDIGVIAQDVEAVLPELVTTRENTGFKAVKYDKIVALLIQSNKELIKQNEDLVSRIEALESKIK